jgi:uncharacterized protein (DUF3820 family)
MIENKDLISIANTEMPFGRYKGTPLIQLSEGYLLWFVDRGFPSGKLGELMQITLEIKINGLEKLIYPLQESPKQKPKIQRDFSFGTDE